MACPEESGKDTPTVKQRHELGKLTECLNKQGKKLLELQATLFKEASITQTSIDERIFDPLVLRYQYDIRTADAMRASLSDSTEELQSLRSNPQKYNFFLECLQNSFVRPESESVSWLGSDIQDRNISNQGKPVRVEVTSETYTDHTRTGLDKTDALKIHQKVADLNVEHTTSSGGYKHNEGQLSNGDNLSRDDWSSRVTTYPKTLLTEDKDTLDDVSEMEYDVAEKYKVFRPKKIRDRKRIFDLFPDPIPSTLPVPKFQSTPVSISFSPEKTNGRARNVHTRESNSGNGNEESIHLTNKSKSANESWYEYKERCSVTSLTDHVQQSDLQKPLSPFYLRDYMKTPPYLVTSPTKSVKSVRFSLSPSQNQRKSSSKARTKYPSDTSSDDDEVGFVQQFPCVEKPGRPRSKERRQLHFY